MTSFGKEVKQSVPCPKILRHVKDSYSMKIDTCTPVSRVFLVKFFSSFDILMGESGVIKTQMRKHNRSEMLAVYGTPGRYHLLNSNSNSTENSYNCSIN
jgi:hypothetical protein